MPDLKTYLRDDHLLVRALTDEGRAFLESEWQYEQFDRHGDMLLPLVLEHELERRARKLGVSLEPRRD